MHDLTDVRFNDGHRAVVAHRLAGNGLVAPCPTALCPSSLTDHQSMQICISDHSIWLIRVNTLIGQYMPITFWFKKGQAMTAVVLSNTGFADVTFCSVITEQN